MKAFLSLLVFWVMIVNGVAASNRASNSPLQPIRIRQPVSPIFPEALARMFPNGGHARILIMVRADGELAEWLVTGYSAPPFKMQAEETLKTLTFEAARLAGEPIAATTEIRFRFEARGLLVSLTQEQAFNRLTQSPFDSPEAYRPYPIGALDRVPAALYTEAPSYPKEVAAEGITGNVTVDFYIDEGGAVRMPSVSHYEPMPLPIAAVRAIRRWKFEVPMHQGKPVLAQARQVFHFNEDPASKR